MGSGLLTGLAGWDRRAQVILLRGPNGGTSLFFLKILPTKIFSFWAQGGPGPP